MPAKVTILGAGISGLAVGWFLKQKHGKAIDLTFVEKSSRVGGWIQSKSTEGFLFEKGPRSCRTAGGRATLELIESLNLQDEVLPAHPSAKQRYLYQAQQLRPFPSSFWALPFSPLLKGWLKAAWSDLTHSTSSQPDETIETFFNRRIGIEWTNRFIDPLVSGIYAGDIKKLSIRSCFPPFFQWEQQHGSLLKGAFKNPKKSSSPSAFVSDMEKSGLFSFKKGMETLPLAIAQRLEADFLFETEVKAIQSLESDVILSTLPSSDLNYASVTTVHLGYRQGVMPPSGFGYLIPTQEREPILGCVFDSAVFPEQGRPRETCLTVMLGGTHHPEVMGWSPEQCLFIATEALKRHTGIRTKPDVFSISRAEKAIPQFEVGHSLWKEQQMADSTVYQLGSAISGVAIKECISYAKNLADKVVVC